MKLEYLSGCVLVEKDLEEGIYILTTIPDHGVSSTFDKLVSGFESVDTVSFTGTLHVLDPPNSSNAAGIALSIPTLIFSLVLAFLS